MLVKRLSRAKHIIATIDKRKLIILLISLCVVSAVVMIYFTFDNSMTGKQLQQKKSPMLQVQNSGLRVELVTEGLSSPTSMDFVDNNNILVLEKDGLVRLISNGVLQKHPPLKVPVNTTSERGLLGIAILNGSNSSKSRGDGGGDTSHTKYTNITCITSNIEFFVCIFNILHRLIINNLLKLIINILIYKYIYFINISFVI